MSSEGIIESTADILSVDESELLSGKVQEAGAKEWPAGGLESVPECPVCGSREREVLYADLQDRVFFCAPGRWILRRCLDCRSAYLDPRPTTETIGLAYRNYLTHLTSHSVLNASGLRAWIRRALGNGYRNHRFGTKDQPAAAIGIVVALLFPSLRAIANSAMRNLPPLPATGRRLLDVGCGNGEFLYRANSVGWETVGVDFDAAAVATSRSLGLDVRLGGVDVLDPAREQFDGITLSHVIEHVHDPRRVLRACHRLLKPGGWIWLDTPNLNSFGHEVFEHAWRGLEPPRHLVLFTRDSLGRALVAAGFTAIEDQPYRQLCKPIFAASEAIAAHRNPWRDVLLTSAARQQAMEAERVARTTPSVREFVTVKGRKPAP